MAWRDYIPGLRSLEEAPPAVSPEERPERTQPKEIGRTGTINTRGFISDTEENNELRWPRNIRTYDKMKRTEITIRWMLSLQKVPILSATYFAEPGGDEPEDLEAAAFVEHMLTEELQGGLIGLLERALRILDYGHSVLEEVNDLRPVTFTYKPKKQDADEEEPEEVVVEKEMLVVARLPERLQKTIHQWVPVEGDSSQLQEIVQFLGDGMEPPFAKIPAKQLVVFTLEKEGDDWRGNSLLRPAWRPWKYKQQLENLEAIAYERSTGIPLVYPPSGNTDSKALDSVEVAVSGVRQGENLFVIMPGPKAGPDVDPSEGWLLEDFGMKGDDTADPDKAIGRHETALARNVQAEFMRLGHTQTGARATGEVQQEPYYLAIQALINYVLSVINERIVEPAVRRNYSVTKVPKLRASRIQAKNLLAIAEALSKLATGKLIEPDPHLEAHLRDLLELPEKAPEEEGEELPVPDGFVQLPDGSVVEDPAAKAAHAQALAQAAGQVQPAEPAGPKPKPKPMPASTAKTRAEATERIEAFSLPRPPRTNEQSVNFSEIHALLENGDADLIELVQRAAEGSVRSLEQAMNTAVAARAPDAVSSLELDSLPMQRAIERVLTQLYDKGQEQVRAEIRRQSGKVMLADGLIKEAATEVSKRVIKAVAKSAAESIANAGVRALKQRALRTIQDGSVPTGAGYDPMAAIRAEAQRAAAGIVSAAFNMGRNDWAMQHSEDVAYSEYSAMLDPNTCSPCAEADGTVGPPGGLPELPTPNPNCAGGGACRCIWIYVGK
jgi:hypothetical protein